MRLLAFDHFFEQDLQALRVGLTAGDELAVLPYQRIWSLARRHFPDDAFHGLERSYEPDLAAQWRSYRKAVRRLTDWIAAAYRPEVFLTPSDSFFYIRPVIDRWAQLGVPTVVVQKETTISPMVMDEHSAVVGRTVPFMSSAMTVCSERQREFWLRAGADRERVWVTGQPRFDVYASRQRRDQSGRPRLLMLSYDDVAYLPSDTGQPFVGSWRDLRKTTEEIVGRFASAGTWDVTVKRHPQQSRQPDWLGRSVTWAERNADTRQLILGADAVLGFQTTALFEAAAAGRPVIYAAWGDLFREMSGVLIPFHEYPQIAFHAASPDDLEGVLRTPETLQPPSAAAKPIIVEHLGPVDGKASERVLSIVREHARRGAIKAPPTTIRQFASAVSRAGGAVPVGIAAGVANATGKPELATRLRRVARRWTQQGNEARSILRWRHRDESGERQYP